MSVVQYDEVPDKFRFSKIKSSDVVSRRQQFQLSTGKDTISSTGLSYKINLQGDGILDWRTLRLNYKINAPATAAGHSYWWNSTLHSNIRRLRVTTTGGKVLININNYDVFMSAIMNKLRFSRDEMRSSGTLEGGYFDNTTNNESYTLPNEISLRRYNEARQKNSMVEVGQVQFSLPLICGMEEEMLNIPLQYLPITIEIEFKSPDKWLYAVNTTATPADQGKINFVNGFAADVNTTNLEYVNLTYDLYHMNEAYNNSLRSRLQNGSLSLVFPTYADHESSGSSGNVRTASGYRNADALLSTIVYNPSGVNGALISQSNGPKVESYQARIGSDVYPEYLLDERNRFLALNAIYKDFDKNDTIMDIENYAFSDNIMYVNFMRDPEILVTGQSLLSENVDVYLVLKVNSGAGMPGMLVDADNQVYSFTKFTRVVSFDLNKNIETYQ